MASRNSKLNVKTLTRPRRSKSKTSCAKTKIAIQTALLLVILLIQYKVKVAHEKWLEARHERNILLQGKFTFASPKDLTLPPGVKDQKDISLIKIDNVRFSYDPEKLPFIFDTPISYDVKVGTRVGIMG